MATADLSNGFLQIRVPVQRRYGLVFVVVVGESGKDDGRASEREAEELHLIVQKRGVFSSAGCP